MSKFTKQIKRTYQFDGDTVVVSMKRLKRKHAIKLAPFMDEPDEDGKVRMNFESSLKFSEKACETLNEYITSFEGLKEEDGSPISKEEVFDEEGSTYFMELISEMMSDLMEASFVGGAKIEKKSEGQQEDASSEQPMISSTLEESQ